MRLTEEQYREALRRAPNRNVRERIAIHARPNKYRNQPERVDGHRFDSKAEAQRYRDLKLMEQAGAIRSLHLQPRFPLEVAGIVVADYVADFCYTDEAGTLVVEDVKGLRTPVYRLKKRMFEAQASGIPFAQHDASSALRIGPNAIDTPARATAANEALLPGLIDQLGADD